MVRLSARPASQVAAAVRSILLASSFGLLYIEGTASAAELPQPCIAGTCGPAVQSWVSSGSAQATQSGSTLTVNQSTDRVILNWASFNVSADGRVVFNQPGRSSIALNRIFQDSPSRIFGQVQANGEIYLVNPNGVVFGRTAVVNAAGILASTLNISDDSFTAGIASPALLQKFQAALQSDGRVNVVDASGNSILGRLDADGRVIADPGGQPITVQLNVQQGAKLSTSGANGRVLLAGQNVSNAGSISSPDGQVILAAGDKVYLSASSDPSLRGLLVEVGASGTVTNAASGEISTPRGNTTLIGMAVNQQGRVSATTTVAANGSIRLLARDSATVALVNGVPTPSATHTGTLTFGAQSVTSVTPELADTQTAVDDQKQEPSRIEGMGHQIMVQGGSHIIANGGALHLSAVTNPGLTIDGDTPTLPPGFQDAGSQLRIESGAIIDLSGSDATLPMSRNQVTVELRANELRDSPDQRNSAIRGQPLVIDARVGTPLGDVSGAIAAIPKTIAERTSQGGTAVFASDGDVVVAKDAVLDVSGGQINYESGYLQTSQLVGADGKLYDVGTADPARAYVGVINPTLRIVDDRWGRISQAPFANVGQLQEGYVEGRSAGTLQFAAPSMVLNGTFRAGTVTGPWQRSATQMPQGGSFIIGLINGIGLGTDLDYRAPSVNFSTSIPNITVASGAALPAWMTLTLPTDYLRNGFTRTYVNSNGTVSIGSGTPLELTPGSVFSLTGQSVSIGSSITDLAGSIQLATHDTIGLGGQRSPEYITLSPDVTLDVSGTWINDSPVLGAATNAPLLFNGGSIALKLGGTLDTALLDLGDGVSLLANGGAYYRNSLSGGRGGAITLASTRSGGALGTTWRLGSGIRAEGFGVANAAGGSFSLDAPAIRIAQQSVWATDQELLADNVQDFLRLGTGLFSDYGFAQLRLTATRPLEAGSGSSAVLEVLPGSTLQARVSSLALEDAAQMRRGGGSVSRFAHTWLPELDARQASTISLNTGQARGNSGDAGSLSIDAGAVLEADPGSTFNFASAGSVLLAGSVRSVGGTVSAHVTPPSGSGVVDTGYVAGQKIQLAATGNIDVAGGPIAIPTDNGLLSGRVSNGGGVWFAADRGMVAIESGSSIDVSGGSATLDLPTGNEVQPYQRQQVGSAGGSLTVKAREGLYMLGAVDAAAGADDSGRAAGGSLRIEVNRNSPAIAAETYPEGSAQINVSEHDFPVVGTVPAGYAGVSRDFIVRGGFDAVSLRAFDNNAADGGRIILNSGLNLSLAQRLTLEAPVIGLTGNGQVSLQAPYIAFGDVNGATSLTTATTGDARLQVRTDAMELLGSTRLTGAAAADFSAAGDLRLRGTDFTDGSSGGDFTIAGDLTLAAARVYASSGTQFTLKALGGLNDRIRFVQSGVSPGTPLSAASRIQVIARDIEQGGTLLAPFGSIALQAENMLTLNDGSLTSVSGNGSLIPYGYVLNGAWLRSNGRTATPLELTALPSRSVSLQADSVSLSAGATVDISGGGDLYAYEWVPGTGGSKDALLAGARPGLYAVLPSTAGQLAPYDPQEFALSDLTPGDSIYLDSYGSLAAGVYPLLPARYALLPGAYLVSVVAGSGDYISGYPAALRDGTAVISGYRTYGNTGIGSAQMSGIAIRPGSYGRRLSEYTDFHASSYLSARARLLELGTTTVPVDAGSLSLYAGQSLSALGKVKTAAGSGGAGATIEVSAEHLAVTGSSGDGDASTVDIAAATLNAWAPARLTLGGTRSGGMDSTLSVSAEQVTVRNGVSLNASDLLLTARDQVTVEAGATLATPSGQDVAHAPQGTLAETHLSFTDDAARGAAVLALSDVGQVRIDRGTGGTSTGSVQLAAGSTLATRGALTLDAPLGAATNGTFNVAGARLAVGADKIIFGSAAQSGALLIDSALQETLRTARLVALTGLQSIEFARDTQLQFTAADTQLELRTASLQAAPDVQVSLAANRVVLGGQDVAGAGPAAGNASLNLRASTVDLQGGSLDLSGFAQTTVTAEQQVTTTGKSQYRTAGDLTFRTPRVALDAAADTSIDAGTGAVRLEASPATSATVAIGPTLGGSLKISAGEILSSTAILAPSGKVVLTAADSLSLQGNASIDAAGRMVSAGGRQLGSAGGIVELLSGGSVTTSDDTRIDVSGAGDSTAGSLAVNGDGAVSLGGMLVAVGNSKAAGGEFDLTAGQLANFQNLNDHLESGGFSRRRSVVVGSGDLHLDAGKQITAQTVELASTTGSVRIDGRVDASAVDAKGAIRIDGGAGLAIGSAASLITDSSGTANAGGDISLGTSSGQIDIASDSRFSATGTGGNGAVVLRAPVVAADIAITALPADLSRTAGAVIAPTFAADVTAAPTNAELNSARQAAINFINQSGSGVLARLGTGNSASLSLRPEIQLRRNGDLTLGALDLSTWRFAGQPGMLSVRATGNLRTTGVISDGFTGTGATLRLLNGPSTSINLSAGGDLTLGNNSIIRTGTGDISLAAGGDLVFSSGASVYTAGSPGTTALSLPARTGNATIVFPDQGGEIHLTAGHDVIGNGVTQSVTDWQFRGTRTGVTQDMPRLWGVSLFGFGWNVGALGGGDVEVRAGHDVRDLAAAAADSAVVDAGNTLSRYGGGSLRVTAANDIDSSQFFAGRGRLDLTAGSALGSSRQSPLGDALGSLLWMADTRASIVARSGVLLESALNPTLLLMPNAPNAGPRTSSFFSYGNTAALRLQSAAGDVLMHNNVDRLAPFIETTVRQQSGEPARFAVYPPQLDARAYSGDVQFEQTAYLYPGAQGSLSLFAQRDVLSNRTGGVLMSDGAQNGMATVLTPAIGAAPITELIKSAAASRHLSDPQAALISAGRDVRDIVFSLPTAAQLVAGRDVSDVSLVTQNVDPQDVTLVQAGRDVRSGSDNIGSQLLTGGPGRLDILAGRDVDLGFSQGVVTTGGLRNATLPFDTGADISIFAGLGRQPDMASFITQVIATSTAYGTQVVEYVRQQGGDTLSQGDALVAFTRYDAATQRPLVTRIFFQELVKSGREANQPGGDFKRGYAAIDALFPGSRSTSGGNPFAGDINMSFSRIYTLAGGDIALLAPGGLLNVGLANPPASFGTRDPSQLGIVAQRSGSVDVFTRGDVLVNQSRIFTLLGGDIAIWSTLGNIDAGRGAKSSLSAPPPTVIIDDTGKVTIDFSAAVAGSGIRTVITGEGVAAGDVDLIAPAGFVNAGDAGIGSAGNLNVAAQSVVGLDNIQVGGVSTGVPAETGGLGASLSGATSVTSSATAASDTQMATADTASQPVSLAQNALTWLDVFVEGFGADNCKPNDAECLERQKK